MSKKTKRRIFTSLAEFDSEFFPETCEQTEKSEEKSDPTAEATQISEHVLSALR